MWNYAYRSVPEINENGFSRRVLVYCPADEATEMRVARYYKGPVSYWVSDDYRPLEYSVEYWQELPEFPGRNT